MALPKYDPFLVPSINFPDKLFCALTNQLITRSLEAVKQHMKGRRFQKAKGGCGAAGAVEVWPPLQARSSVASIVEHSSLSQEEWNSVFHSEM